MTIQPMHDYVMIRRLPDTQIGRIHIPDTVDTKPRIGIVEAIGPGRRAKDGTRIPMSVNVGDRVSFSLESGFVNQLPGERHRDAKLLIRDTGILAVLDPEAEASALGSPWPEYVRNLPDPSKDTDGE